VRAVVHVEHCNERYLPWRRWTAQRLARATTATVCVSQSVADFAGQHRLLSPIVRVIPNSTDVVRFGRGAPDFATRAPDIVMMARFARQKDQATLIRATSRLIASGWTGRLLLAGGGGPRHRQRCEELARRLGVASRVDFLGAVGDPAALYHRCRAAVLSTHYEGMPLALIESMAAGCASAGSAVPGVIDVIRDRETGWLFPAQDDAALADVLRGILAGGPDVEAVVARGVAVAADSFSPAKQIDRYESLFRELLSS
jgi:glycosyltransferase involved in cell wall biosynthesis